MNTCQLCAADFTAAWNVPLLESPNFVVLPSLGALVEGWVLLLPKRHFLSVGALPDVLMPEMQELKATVCDRVQRKYGFVGVFEHGPSGEHLRVGCGVDHAHLHIVPVDFDLSIAVAPYLPPYSNWSSATLADCRTAFRSGDDYLYLEQPVGEMKIIRHRHLGSQVFRRAIASHLGVPEQFDWRSNPQIENVEKTAKGFVSEGHCDTTPESVPEYAA